MEKRNSNSIINSITSVVGWIAAALAFLMMMMVVGDVVMRFLFNSPLNFADEYSGYLMAAIVFLGLGYTLRAGMHININLLPDALPRKAARRLDIVTSIVSLLYVLWFLAVACLFVLDSYLVKVTHTNVTRTPMYIPQMLLPIGLVFMAMQMVVEIIKKVRPSKENSNKGVEVSGQL